jgi:hypothetical protein
MVKSNRIFRICDVGFSMTQFCVGFSMTQFCFSFLLYLNVY